MKLVRPLVGLKEYLTSELERFNREWQDTYERIQHQRQGIDKYETALDVFNTAPTLEDTRQVLKRQKSLLLKKEALDTLRTRITLKRQQKASGHWIFLLEHDLELLEVAIKHGLDGAMQYLDARTKMLQQQQSVFEALKILALLDPTDPQTFIHVVEMQETNPFSRETLLALHALVNAMDDPEHRKQLQTLLHLLEDVQKLGKEQALIKHMRMLRPDFESEIDHTIDVLKQYLTSDTVEEAYLTLKQNQDILLSDTAHWLMEQQIAERYSVGDHCSANMLEYHLHLFEDTHERGLEAAWQTFTEDDE